MDRYTSIIGLVVMLLLAWLLSNNRKKMNFRLILSGLALQFLLALLILQTSAGQQGFQYARDLVTKVLSFSDEGAKFVFGKDFKEHPFAFSVLPTIIFISSLMAVLFHLGILQKIVEFFAKIMFYVMNASGSEALAAAANVFIGMAEAAVVVKPYMRTMTSSELMAMMTGGMATISGATLAAYTRMGADAGHLLTASIISAPAAIVIAKVMQPETQESPTMSAVKVSIPRRDTNVLDAACRGAVDGAKLALSIAAVLISFIGLIALLNWPLSLLPEISGEAVTLQRILGWACAPLAWIMGVNWSDAPAVGTLIGEKTIINEFVAYGHLVEFKGQISERSFTIATYALCGFANFGSVAIQIGGYSSIVPERRKDFAKLGLRAMIGGSLAAFMTATIAGILI